MSASAIPPGALRWRTSDDTGISSCTIFEVLSGHTDFDLARWSHRWPHDPSDFGRCHRLLLAAPEWRWRLGEVATAHPAWAPFVAAWDEMERLFVEEEPSGTAPKLYDLMKRLDAESRGVAAGEGA